MPFVSDHSATARLEAQIERAFGPLPIPPRGSILGWMLHSTGEEDWVLWAYGDKRYDEVDPEALDYSILTQTLSPSAFAYYVGSAALAAVRAPTLREDLSSCASSTRSLPRRPCPRTTHLDLPRVRAIRAVLAHVGPEVAREEREWLESGQAPDGAFAVSEDSQSGRVAKAERVVEAIERLLVGA